MANSRKPTKSPYAVRPFHIQPLATPKININKLSPLLEASLNNAFNEAKQAQKTHAAKSDPREKDFAPKPPLMKRQIQQEFLVKQKLANARKYMQDGLSYCFREQAIAEILFGRLKNPSTDTKNESEANQRLFSELKNSLKDKQLEPNITLARANVLFKPAPAPLPDVNPTNLTLSKPKNN